MSFGTNESSSGSQPVNVTPGALQGNYGPFAKALQRFIGGGTLRPRQTIKDARSIAGVPFAPIGSGVTDQNPFSAVAPMSAGEAGSLNALNSYAGATGGTTQNYLNNVMGGQYLTPGSNPFLQSAIQAAQQGTLNSLTGQFGAAGQTLRPGAGSSAFSYSAANALGNIASQMSNQQYQNERQLQQGAVGLNQQQMGQMIQNLQANALPRTIQQQGIQTGLGLFQNQMQSFLQALQTITGQAGASNIGQKSQSKSGGFNVGVQV